MEYPFKDLQPLDEATARTGYYKDWTHIDANTFHQISELVKFIREKGYGADTREAIAQALERVYHDALLSGNANMEVSMARKHFKDLASRLDASDNDMRNISVDWINKNLGKLDQTFMSDEFLQQMAGNTPINAVPADRAITTEKIAKRAITGEEVADKTLPNLITKLDGYKPPKNLLFSLGVEWIDDTLLSSSGSTVVSTTYKSSKPIYLPHSRPNFLIFKSSGNGVVNFYNAQGDFLFYRLIENTEPFAEGIAIEIPSSAASFAVSLRKTETQSQIELGQFYTGYSDSREYEYTGAKSLNDNITYNNLLIGRSVIDNTLLLTGGGTATSSTYKTFEGYIELDPTQTHLTYTSEGNGIINFYDDNTNLVLYRLIQNDEPYRNGISIEIPTDATKIRVTVRKSSVNSKVEYGQVFTGFDDSEKYRLRGLDVGATKEYVDRKIAGSKQLNTSSEIEMFTAYGQSWAQGYDTDAISTTQLYDNLMLNTGVTNEPLEDYDRTATALVPLIEENGTAGTQRVGESPTAGQTTMVKMLIEAENGLGINDIKYQLLGNSPGMGSTSMEQLSKGTAPYNRLIAQVQQAYTLAQAQGKTFKVSAFSWAQGAGGYTGTDYAQSLENLRADIEVDVKAITGQDEPVKCITWQAFARTNNESKRLYDRYVEASERFEHIVCSGPTYQLATISKANLHFNALSSMHLGAYFGQAFKRTINDGIKFEPLKPVGITIQGRIALIKFNNDTPLAFDTSIVSLAKDYGFKVLDGNGNDVTKYGSIDVSIVNRDAIKIINVRKWRDTDRIVYGDTGVGWGGTDGKRGNLRDSSPLRYQYLSHNLPMYNWCVAFDKAVSDF